MKSTFCKKCSTELFKGSFWFKNGLFGDLQPIDENVQIQHVAIDCDPSTNLSDVELKYCCRVCKDEGILNSD